MKRFPKLILFGLLFSIAIKIQAQLYVTGVFQDTKEAPIPFASVLLLNSADSTLVKGQISDDTGHFSISISDPGKYLVSATSIGYKELFTEVFHLNKNNSPMDLGRLVTGEDVMELGEVVIQAEKPLFEQKIDRTVINVGSNITASGGTALDVLERSPGITVDRMNNVISLSGKQGVRIMVNGKLTKMPIAAAVQMLAGMNAENIEKIELITTPPAKYEAEGDAGMINIVMKKTADLGTNGSYSVFTGYGKKEKYGGGINFNHRSKNFNLYGDYSYRMDVSKQIWNSERVVQINGNPEYTVVDNDRYPFERFHNGRLGFDWMIGNKTIIGGLLSIVDRKWDMDAFSNISQQVASNSLTFIEMTTKEVNAWKLFLGNISLTHDFSDNQSISFDFDHINYDSNNPTDYFQEFFDEQQNLSGVGALRSRKDTPINTWVTKVDYSAKIGERVILEAGAKGSFSKLKNVITVDSLGNGIWVPDASLTSDADMTDNIGAGYVSATINASPKIELQLGLRYEYTRTDIDTRMAQNIVDRSFGKLFPSLFINNKINKNNSWVLSYSRRVTRPSFLQLAPFVIFSDPNSFFSGNVSLLPSFTDAVKAEYRHKSILFSLQYSHDKNAISSFQPRINQDNKKVSSAENLNYMNNYSATLSFPIQVTDWWEMQYNLIGSLIKVKASYLQNPVELSVGNININASQRFNLPGGFTLEISGFFQSKQFWGVMEYLAFGSLNLGLEKKFNNSTLRASYSDVLSTNKWDWVTNLPTENLNSREIIKFDTRVFRLTYSKSFGNSKLKGKRYNQTGSEEEQRRFN